MSPESTTGGRKEGAGPEVVDLESEVSRRASGNIFLATAQRTEAAERPVGVRSGSEREVDMPRSIVESVWRSLLWKF